MNATRTEIEILERAVSITASRTSIKRPIEYLAVEDAVLRVAYSGQAVVEGCLDPLCLAAAACQVLKEAGESTRRPIAWLADKR